MTWFKVDDRLHAHPKTLATSLAALGLWTVAGSWSSDHLTDGFIPDHVIPLLARGSIELADELVSSGLWRRARGGYRFHQWHEDGDGSRRNPTKKEVENERRMKAEAGRKGGLASGKTRSRTGSKNEAGAKAKPKLAGVNSRPDPTRPTETRGDARTHEPSEAGPPPHRCPEHLSTDGPIPPCRACADARRAHDAWRQQHPNGTRASPLDTQQIAARDREQRAARVARGEACPTCNDTGLTLNDDGDAIPCTCKAKP